MTPDPTLTPTELAALAGPSMPRWFLVWDTTGGANTVATGRVNGTVSYPLITIPVDGTSAGWAAIVPNMTIFIGSTPGGFDRGIYRVRKAGTSSTLEIMAIAQNDSGEIAFVTRDAGITDNDYITVLYRFDMFGIFPRIDYSGVGVDATIYEDWDKSYTDFNQYPPPRVNVTIAGRPENYGTHVYSGTSATFDIVLSIGLWPTSSSATWAITLPAGVTLNSGSLTGSGTSATINVTAPHAADAYVFKFVATENHGNSFTAYRKAWITSNTYPPARIVRIDMAEDDLTGSKRTITLNSQINAPPGALYHMFDMGNWNGSDVATAIHAFSGYAVSASESTEIGVSSVTIQLIGPSYMLEQIGGQSQIFSVVSGTPATWQEIVASLSYLDFIIWGYLYQRVAGLLQMFNWTPFGLTNTQKRMTGWYIDTGTLLAQAQAQAARIIGGNFGCDPSGEVMLRVRPSRVWGSRSGLTTRFSLDYNQYSQANLGTEKRPRVRRLRTEAFYSDAITDTPIWADAPQIPGQGQSEQKQDRLIVDSPTELYQGTGLEYAARNNKYPNGSVAIKKNWAVIKPAQLLRGYLDIAAAVRYDNAQLTGYILPTRVSYTHNPDGTIDTTIGFEAETTGTIGVDAPIPVPDPSQYQSRYQATRFAPIPSRRRANPNPAGTVRGAQVVPKDGSVGFCGTATQAFLVLNFLGTPAYRDVTPTGLSAFTIRHGMVQFGGTRAWLLVSDGTDSKVYTTANLFALPRPTWTAGTAYSGLYTILRPTNVSGGILIESPGDAGAWTQTFNLAAAQGVTVNRLGQGVYSPGVGWTENCVLINAVYYRGVTVDANISPSTITSLTAVFDQTIGPTPNTPAFNVSTDGINYTQPYNIPPVSGLNQTMTWSGSLSGIVSVEFNSNVSTDSGSCGATSGNVTLKTFTVEGLGINPFGGAGNSVVRYSSNNGSTFGGTVTIGTSPGAVAGFDVVRGTAVSYGTMLNKTRKASTAGGAYSDDQAVSGTSPNLIEAPWYTRNSNTALNTGSSPQYIYGTPVVDGSGKALYWVVGGSPVDITPVVGGNPGLSVSPNNLATWKGKYIAGVFDFAGTRNLATSINGGTAWSNRGAAAGATYVRVRRLAKTPGQIYIAGDSILQYSPDFGASRVNKTRPSSSALVFFEPVG